MMISKVGMRDAARHMIANHRTLLSSKVGRHKAITSRPFAKKVQRNGNDDDNNNKNRIPPVLLYQTASPHVYISKYAIENENSPNFIHPKTLFADTNKIPRTFLSSQFAYIPPKQFNHELPMDLIPEVAFLGRSNVGKSSLLNALTQKNLAKTSKTPGRTQSVNYFGLFPHRDETAIGYIIDLPGYGYAQAPEKDVDKWQQYTQEFLQERTSSGHLERVYILVDSRRGLSIFDSTICSWLDEVQCNYSIILTKSDAVGKSALVKAANEICMRYHLQEHETTGISSMSVVGGFQGPLVHATSAQKNQGIVELMYSIENDFYTGMERMKTNHKTDWSK
jgi:GTP-binding protein